jgi:hypothetical protein
MFDDTRGHLTAWSLHPAKATARNSWRRSRLSTDTLRESDLEYMTCGHGEYHQPEWRMAGEKNQSKCSE